MPSGLKWAPCWVKPCAGPIHCCRLVTQATESWRSNKLASLFYAARINMPWARQLREALGAQPGRITEKGIRKVMTAECGQETGKQ